MTKTIKSALPDIELNSSKEINLMQKFISQIGLKIATVASSCILAIFFSGCSPSSDLAGNSLKIIDYDGGVMQQFLWLHYSVDLNEKDFPEILSQGDPFRATALLFRDFYDNRDIEKTGRLLDALIRHWNLYETHRLDYTFSYGQLKAEWWSGMDNMMLPMLLVAYTQVQKNDEYLNLANKILNRILRSPSDGGILWRNNDGCWFSEYSWNGMRQADEYYVLNGHLLALESLKLIANALGRADLDEIYQCGLNGTKKRAREFLEQGGAWALYMLQPPTINQVHYLIFETIQFDNLYNLTGDAFFKNEAELRREVLAERYPIYSIGPMGDQRIFFSMMGAPHLYSLDTYGIRIACESPGGPEQNFKQFNHLDESKPLLDRIFIDEKMYFDKNTSCSVYSHSAGLEFLLYKTSDFINKKYKAPPESIEYEVDASLDGYMNGERGLVVDPARTSSETEEYLNTQARINYKLSPVNLIDASFLGFELTPDQDLAIGVQLSDGVNTIFRYYPKLKSGKKNIVLLSKFGFDDGKKLNNITGAIIFVYTHDQKDKAAVDLGRVLFFSDQSSLKPYFENNDVYMYVE